MNQIIIALCLFGAVFCGPPPPECMQGAPGSPTKIKECCKLPEVIPQDVFDKCEAANPKPTAMTGPPKGCCMSECVMNETKIMVNGALDKAVAVKYLTEKMVGDAESIKVVTAAVDFCENEAKSKKGDFDEMAKLAAPGEKVCHMMSGFMIGCVTGQIFKNCPKDKSGADAECDKIKAFVDKCVVLFPKPKG